MLFIYPMTGCPDVAMPEGWNEIPGARGCTPQSHSFRDLYKEFKLVCTVIFGLSTQSLKLQQQIHAGLHMPFNYWVTAVSN